MELSGRHLDYSTPDGYAWEPLDPTIQLHVKTVKQGLTSENNDDQIVRLNRYLMMDSVGLGVAHLRIRAENDVLFYHERLRSDNTISAEPVVDPDILNQSVVEGSFVQCVSLDHGGGKFDVGYELCLDHPGDGRLVAIIPDGSVTHLGKRIAISEEEVATEREAGNIEKKIGRCFKRLRAVKDKEFRELVQDFSDVFYSEDVDGADFCREVGLCATELLNHPAIIAHQDYVLALEYILRYSLDDDKFWYIEGIADDMVIRGNEVYPDNIREVALKRANYVGVTMLSPEIEIKNGIATATHRMTPAYIFEHRLGDMRERVTMPLIHIKYLHCDLDTPPEAGWRQRYEEYVRTHQNVGSHLAELAMRYESEREERYGS